MDKMSGEHIKTCHAALHTLFECNDGHFFCTGTPTLEGFTVISIFHGTLLYCK